MARRRRRTTTQGYTGYRDDSPWLTRFPGVPDAPTQTTNPNPTSPSPVSPPQRSSGGDVQALPFDPMLDAYQLSAGRQAAVGDAYATFQTGEINRDFGFDDTGGIDPNNPYSRAALLQRSYQDAVRGNTNSYAAAGQLYSGALKNAQNRSYQDFDIGLDRLRTQRNQGLADVTLDKLDSYAALGSGVDDETFKALLRALTGGS